MIIRAPELPHQEFQTPTTDDPYFTSLSPFNFPLSPIKYLSTLSLPVPVSPSYQYSLSLPLPSLIFPLSLINADDSPSPVLSYRPFSPIFALSAEHSLILSLRRECTPLCSFSSIAPTAPISSTLAILSPGFFFHRCLSILLTATRSLPLYNTVCAPLSPRLPISCVDNFQKKNLTDKNKFKLRGFEGEG
jgi:hypothetical protein